MVNGPCVFLGSFGLMLGVSSLVVARLESEAALKKNAAIHAGEHGHAPARLVRQIFQLGGLEEVPVGFEEFVGN